MDHQLSVAPGFFLNRVLRHLVGVGTLPAIGKIGDPRLIANIRSRGGRESASPSRGIRRRSASRKELDAWEPREQTFRNEWPGRAGRTIGVNLMKKPLYTHRHFSAAFIIAAACLASVAITSPNAFARGGGGGALSHGSVGPSAAPGPRSAAPSPMFHTPAMAGGVHEFGNSPTGMSPGLAPTAPNVAPDLPSSMYSAVDAGHKDPSSANQHHHNGSPPATTSSSTTVLETDNSVPDAPSAPATPPSAVASPGVNIPALPAPSSPATETDVSTGGTTGPVSQPGGGGDTLADCMALWEPATHMSKVEWRQTCKRTLNAIELAGEPTPNTTAKSKRAWVAHRNVGVSSHAGNGAER